MTIIDGVSGPPDTDLVGGLGGVALAAAWAGREAIAAVLAAGGLRTDTKSAAHDLVTTADRAAEAAVLEGVRPRPDDSVLGEETGAHGGTSAVRWLVDPLDGTDNFVTGGPAGRCRWARRSTAARSPAPWSARRTAGGP